MANGKVAYLFHADPDVLKDVLLLDLFVSGFGREPDAIGEDSTKVVEGFLTGHPLVERLPIDINERTVVEDVAAVADPEEGDFHCQYGRAPLNEFLRLTECEETREKPLDLSHITRSDQFFKVDNFQSSNATCQSTATGCM